MSLEDIELVFQCSACPQRGRATLQGVDMGSYRGLNGRNITFDIVSELMGPMYCKTCQLRMVLTEFKEENGTEHFLNKWAFNRLARKYRGAKGETITWKRLIQIVKELRDDKC